MTLRLFFKLLTGAAIVPKAVAKPNTHPEYLMAGFDPAYGQSISCIYHCYRCPNTGKLIFESKPFYQPQLDASEKVSEG